MEQAFHHVELTNGLVLSFFDQTNRYYGDYHRVRVEVRAPIPICPTCFPTAADPEVEAEKARLLLGSDVVFRAELERMGVAGGDVETVRRELVERFVRTSRVYLELDEFPCRYLSKQLDVKRRGGVAALAGICRS
ncbi:MAG: hypothetical protein C0616_02720 [Desulfuromonas sp.]|nr:MAG: hypothetical protein C0616_02720 [Desulfuromonas sp.]